MTASGCDFSWPGRQLTARSGQSKRPAKRAVGGAAFVPQWRSAPGTKSGGVPRVRLSCWLGIFLEILCLRAWPEGRKLNPCMFRCGPRRHFRLRKLRILKTPDSNSHSIWLELCFPINGCTAIWAERFLRGSPGFAEISKNFVLSISGKYLIIIEICAHPKN